MIKRAMAKIAYGALYYYLGDDFLNDPMVSKWQEAFLKDNEAAQNSGIRGIVFDADSTLNLMLPKLEPYEHAVCIGNFNQKGLFVAVTLFGNFFHTFLAQGTDSSHYDLSEAEGMVIICDAKQRKSRFLNLMDVLIEKTKQM